VAADSPKSVSGLGIASLSVGVAGLLLAIIPFPCIGIVGLPIGGIGLILGIIGLIVALSGQREGVGLPISGSVVSLLACVAAAISWYISVHTFVSNVKEGVTEFGKRMEEQAKEMQKRAEEERKEEERKENQAKANPVIVSAKDLLDAYDTNPVAADGKYKGNWLEVAGEVDKIEKVAKIDVTLKDQGRGKGQGIKCEFEDNQQAAVAQLKPGDKVTIKGKCLGKFTSVGLEKCEVVKK
jgi:hypothetical protein